jgi:hypothetical protein
MSERGEKAAEVIGGRCLIEASQGSPMRLATTVGILEPRWPSASNRLAHLRAIRSLIPKPTIRPPRAGAPGVSVDPFPHINRRYSRITKCCCFVTRAYIRSTDFWRGSHAQPGMAVAAHAKEKGLEFTASLARSIRMTTEELGTGLIHGSADREDVGAIAFVKGARSEAGKADGHKKFMKLTQGNFREILNSSDLHAHRR